MGIFDFNQSNILPMKKLYSFFLVLVLLFAASLVSCGPNSDTMPDAAELFNDDAIIEAFDNAEYDPTDPPDSTYDPFPDGN